MPPVSWYLHKVTIALQKRKEKTEYFKKIYSKIKWIGKNLRHNTGWYATNTIDYIMLDQANSIKQQQYY